MAWVRSSSTTEGCSDHRVLRQSYRICPRVLTFIPRHADATELVGWMEDRLPVAGGVFLVHEDEAIEGLRGRLAELMPADRLIVPQLDEAFELRPGGARTLGTGKTRRIEPGFVGRMDWNNDLSKLLLEINEAVDQAADERAKGVIIRRVRRVGR